VPAAAPSGATGTLTGTVCSRERADGPCAVPSSFHLALPDGSYRHIVAGADGRFSVALPAGDYGINIRYTMTVQCVGTPWNAFTVRPDETVTRDVNCSLVI
jgi:hypothetical protein